MMGTRCLNNQVRVSHQKIICECAKKKGNGITICTYVAMRRWEKYLIMYTVLIAKVDADSERDLGSRFDIKLGFSTYTQVLSKREVRKTHISLSLSLSLSSHSPSLSHLPSPFPSYLYLSPYSVPSC